MAKNAPAKIIKEPAREIKVCYEADVVVVGGGPAGVSAAVAAARSGAKTVLVERYGHLGGMATGGQVLMWPSLVAGLCQEIVDKADAMGGCLHMKKGEAGSTDPKVVEYWQARTFGMGARSGTVGNAAYFDMEMLKCVLNNMVDEAGVKIFIHSWGTEAIVEKDKVQGVIFESKSGRQAILGKVIIDTTGDGDIFATAGAEFDNPSKSDLKSSELALVFRLGNVDFMKFDEFKRSKPEKNDELIGKMEELFNEEARSRLRPSTTWKYRMLPQATSRDDVVWVNNFIQGLSAINVEDLTWVEVNVRKLIPKWHNFVKKNFPGFERSFIIDTAPQIGIRTSRMLVGEYVITRQDIEAGTIHKDSVVVFGSMGPRGKQTYFPYRSLVPRAIDGLLAAGRCASGRFRVIPCCVAMGQAAGTAAALATKRGVSPRKVDYKELQNALIKQGIPLPVGR